MASVSGGRAYTFGVDRRQRLVSLMRVCVCVCSVADCTVPRLIQQNDGTGDFNRSWAEYKVGFGDPSGNYWLGNDLLSQLTANNRYKLRFDLQSLRTGNWYYAEYSRFLVLSEAENYMLVVNGYSGNASFDAFVFHNDVMFSTFDRDNDPSSGNCAARTGGGFWGCGPCRVNGARRTRNFEWGGLSGSYPDLQHSRMWVQCKP